MLSLYEILKASKTGLAPDMWTALAGKNWGGADSGAEVKELTGIPPLSFRADGKPLIDYTIYGNMTQSKECGERTRNLFDKDNAVFSGFYPNADTGAVVNTTSGKFLSIIVQCEPNTSYTWSFDRIVANLRNRVAGYSTYPTVDMACTFLDTETDPQPGSTRAIQKFTTTADTHWLILMVTGTGQTAETLTEDVAENAQLEIGTEMTSYEPYGYKIPILSANTTMPVYLGEIESTRKIKKLVLTGEETITGDIEYNRFLFTIPDMRSEGVRLTKLFCTHYQNISDGRPVADVPNNSIYTGGGADSQKVFIKATDYTTGTAFKTYLAEQYAAGTPVTVWYVLANEETAVVNEPLRKIGNYADTVSMEQAGVQIPTNRGNTVIDVETTLKPSEMYIKYKG